MPYAIVEQQDLLEMLGLGTSANPMFAMNILPVPIMHAIVEWA